MQVGVYRDNRNAVCMSSLNHNVLMARRKYRRQTLWSGCRRRRTHGESLRPPIQVSIQVFRIGTVYDVLSRTRYGRGVYISGPNGLEVTDVALQYSLLTAIQR